MVWEIQKVDYLHQIANRRIQSYSNLSPPIRDEVEDLFERTIQSLAWKLN